TRPGTGCPYRPWPGGCWRWASWPPSPRTWPTAGPEGRPAPWSRPGPPPASSAATSCCCGSSGPALRGARGQSPAQGSDQAGHPFTDLRMVPIIAAGANGSESARGGSETAGTLDGCCTAAGVDLDGISVPGWSGSGGAYQLAGQQAADR